MTEDEIADCRWKIQYKADYSARYHRRRSTFFERADLLINLAAVISGATAFGDIVAGTPHNLAKGAIALVTLLSIIQIILRFGSAGVTHAQWMKRWINIQKDIEISPKPSEEHLKRWLAERSSIEGECVSELRALTIDCEDSSARFFDITGRQHDIHFLQRLLIHFGTFQQNIPYSANQPVKVPAKKARAKKAP